MSQFQKWTKWTECFHILNGYLIKIDYSYAKCEKFDRTFWVPIRTGDVGCNIFSAIETFIRRNSVIKTLISYKDPLK